MDVPRNICLRDLQRDLCALYKERFPKMMAVLTVLGEEFDSFQDSPFVAVHGDEVVAVVSFQENNFDPFFYDWMDRRVTKATLSEEMQWEEETANGATDLALVDWLCARLSAAELGQIDVALLAPWHEDL